jgi:hypothetical protein
LTKKAFPLNWPTGWKRTTPIMRGRAKFSRRSSDGGQLDLTINQALDRVLDELGSMGAELSKVLISSNLELRNDGLPRSGQRAPADPGVAVYWNVRFRKDQRCMAIDRYDRVQDNLAAIAATLNAMRAIERHGGAAILDRAFTGFAALPAVEQWWQVLGVTEHASKDTVEESYRRLAAKHHPDRGGDDDLMSRINRARDQGMENFV